jgi:Flp pilus assembly protein TadG
MSRDESRREAGVVTVFMALASTAMLLMVGLVVDGGARLRALGRAHQIAQEAARAAAEEVDTRGEELLLDRGAAVAAGREYLRQAHVAGTVIVTDRRTVRVTATVAGTYLILGITGHNTYTVSAAATASATVGVNGP